ncbi:MAG: hypothetical protein DSY60_03565 [Persephonella sp.]|nr:MAG: hypothetical protein DSY60_03565 [Persephonella sp.]
MNKKIILYNPTLLKGGLLESNKLLAKGFSNRGYEIVIIANRKSDNTIGDFQHYYLNAGDIVRPFKLKRLIEEIKPIAVFSNMLPQNISLSLAKSIAGKNLYTRYFGIVRTSSSHLVYGKFYKLPYRFFVKRMYSNLDKIIAVSTTTKMDLMKTFFLEERNIEVIHNPIDFEVINRLKEEPLSDYERKLFSGQTLLYVGRFNREKRLDLLLKVFYKVKSKIPEVKLIIVGDGEEKLKLVKMIGDLNLNNSAYILPFTRNPFKYMKHATLTVFTSHNEGFPRVVIESLACNTPVVAYINDYSGHIDIIEDGKNGFLVPFDNENELVNKILILLKNEKIYNSFVKNSLPSIRKFSLENVIDKFIKLINMS